MIKLKKESQKIFVIKTLKKLPIIEIIITAKETKNRRKIIFKKKIFKKYDYYLYKNL